MTSFSKEILAYALQNALEFGKTDAARILPKLFSHGLEKSEIKTVMPEIQTVVKRVNALGEEERLKEFETVKGCMAQHEVEEKGLSELPGTDTKKKMVFRLAPFPSGALHIGNAKTYVLNAIYAEKYNADIILVMDDTIGSVKKPLVPEGYKLIEDAFAWLNVKYKKVVYKSDRLKIYYSYAEKLIEKGKAYVCHCTQEELRENRVNGKECSCRQFPPGMQLLRWKEMFNAKEGEVTLRIKTDMSHPNPAFRDRVLFKVAEREHPRVGTKYTVWPSLEMSWAIDDHELGVTHILRGNDLMMETEMEQYIWDIFKWNHPVVVHTGLINLEGTGAKVSKSKAQQEVKSGLYTGWDDPRTWSIQSLAKRGIKPEALRTFVEDIGLNKQDITVPIESLYAVNRRLIDAKTNRYSFVVDPVRIQVTNSIGVKEIEVPIHPDTPTETRTIRIGKTISVSGEDYKTYEDKEVRLLHLFNTILKKETTITSIDNKKIPRLNWVSIGEPTRILMPNGEWVNGLADEGIATLKKGTTIQFERFGFVRYNGKHENIHEFWFAHK